MKKSILRALVYLAMGILVTAAFLAIMALFLSMPNILEWMSGYIGELTTWVIFLFASGAFVYYCITKK